MSIGLDLVGYYQASEFMNDVALAPVGEKIAEAATRGGAEGVIKKLKNGLDHFLERDDTVISSQPLTSGPLFDFFNSLEQNSSVSGTYSN